MTHDSRRMTVHFVLRCAKKTTKTVLCPNNDHNSQQICHKILSFNPIALRMAKILLNFGHSGCNRVKRKRYTWVKFSPQLTQDSMFWDFLFAVPYDGAPLGNWTYSKREEFASCEAFGGDLFCQNILMVLILLFFWVLLPFKIISSEPRKLVAGQTREPCKNHPQAEKLGLPHMFRVGAPTHGGEESSNKGSVMETTLTEEPPLQVNLFSFISGIHLNDKMIFFSHMLIHATLNKTVLSYRTWNLSYLVLELCRPPGGTLVN